MALRHGPRTPIQLCPAGGSTFRYLSAARTSDVAAVVRYIALDLDIVRSSQDQAVSFPSPTKTVCTGIAIPAAKWALEASDFAAWVARTD